MLIKAVIKRTELEDLPSVISRYCKGTVNQQKPNAMAGRSKAGRSYTLEVCAWLFASALPPDQSPRATFSHVVLTADMREDAGSSLKRLALALAGRTAAPSAPDMEVLPRTEGPWGRAGLGTQEHPPWGQHLSVGVHGAEEAAVCPGLSQV